MAVILATTQQLPSREATVLQNIMVTLMAIVANLGIPGYPIDPPLRTPNRIIGVNPVGVTTPLYSGEIVLDNTTTKIAYYATGTTSSSWVQWFVDSD